METTPTVVTTLLGCGVVTLLVVLVVGLVLARRGAAAQRIGRERLEQELARARTDVAALGRRLDDLGDDVLAARQAPERARARSAAITSEPDLEFVITSLGVPGPTAQPGARAGGHEKVRSPGSFLEERLVEVASRHSDTASGAAVSRVLVHAAALGHGVRRAMSAEVRDRAAAEATVARRRSRRDRKRELREARRVLRTVQERPAGKHVA